MSGSSLDGLDIAYAHFQETGGKWSFEIKYADCFSYPDDWINQLSQATALPAVDYHLLHTSYGHYTGELVNRFIDKHDLHHKVDLVSSHGHTTFHIPSRKMTAQLGDGAAIAAVTGLPVISDLRAMDIALGGQGAPIVPIGEKLLLPEFDLLLNLGGIANISAKSGGDYVAFDICSANRILNMLSGQQGVPFDEDGLMAASGKANEALLYELGRLEYYKLPYPKSLANAFGVEMVYPLIINYGLETPDALRTYVEHIVDQIRLAIVNLMPKAEGHQSPAEGQRLLVTGGGAKNKFVISRLQQVLEEPGIKVVVPEDNLINFKEAVIMGLMGVLRWREENNTLASVTGAKRNSIGGAIWMGAEA